MSPIQPTPKALVVGISGPSSSGKTTLARLLQRIFCGVALNAGPEAEAKLNTFIIHEDDFYYPDDQIPYTTTPSGTTLQDWDTAAAIDTNFLAQALAYVCDNGTLPPRLRSKEDQNEDSGSGVPDALVKSLREKVEAQLRTSSSSISTSAAAPKTIAFMEGFLLYSPPDTEGMTGAGKVLQAVHSQIQLPLFLPAAYKNVKTRREGRSGYVTIGPAPGPSASNGENAKREDKEAGPIDLDQEDDRPPQNFWTDPPGYVDDIVWPRYVEDHAWLLIADDSVEGDLIAKVGDGTNVRMDVGVRVAPGKGDLGMSEVVQWAVQEILDGYLASSSGTIEEA